MTRAPARSLLLAALCVGALTAPAGAQGEDAVLPDVLLDHGFRDPAAPISVVFVAPAGDETDHPKLVGSESVAPPNTLWVFDDPSPVRKALALASTRSFASGRIPGADARLILYAGPEGARSRIYLNYRPGWGVVKADRKTGGEWIFDPVADRALVDLLSRTPPRAVGYPVRRVVEAAWKEDPKADGPDFGTIGVPADWARLKRRVVTRFESAELKLPGWFSWDTHFVAVAWLPARDSRDRLGRRGSRLSGDTITWNLSEDREKEEAERWAPVTIGFFPRPEADPARFQVRLDGKVVENRVLAHRMPMPNAPKLVALLVPRTADGARIGTLPVFADRTWSWEPDDGDREGGGCREGRIPPEIAGEIFAGLAEWKHTDPEGVRRHEIRIAGEDASPPGTRELLELVGIVR